MTKITINNTVRLIDMQSLRGIASVIVMLFHSGTLYSIHVGQTLFMGVFTFGYVGVDIFFVLSGFIIYWIHYVDLGKPNKLLPYVIKRAFRIFPLYWIVVLLKALSHAKDFDWLTILCAIALIPYNNPPYINLSWTLSLEVFFYILFGLAIIIKTRYTVVFTCVALLLMALLQPPYENNENHFFSVLNFYFEPHLIEFVFGMMSAFLLVKGFVFFPSHIAFIGIITWLTIFITSTIGSIYTQGAIKEFFTPQNVTFLFGLPTAILVYGLAGREILGLKPFMSSFKFFGDISYSLYLIHGFVIYFSLKIDLFKITVKDFPMLIFLPMLLSVILSWLSYKYIEQPFIALGRNCLNRLRS